jgi:hypothetical protein
MLILFVVVVVMVGVYMLNGVALQLLWNWFMVPTLGLPAISLVQAIGIGILISFLTHQHIPREKEERKQLFAFVILNPIIAIAFGWVVHLFM